jgi:serine/threonine protein kinase
MGLVPGTRLGKYEITGPLGAGGTGEAYRATDTKLGRDVAIKLLPDALAFRPGGGAATGERRRSRRDGPWEEGGSPIPLDRSGEEQVFPSAPVLA